MAPSVAGVPVDATAVTMNVTVTGAKSQGYVTVFPSGSARPVVSNVNFVAGATVANGTTVKVGSGGRVTLYASAGCPDVLVDVSGYISSGA